MTALKYDPDPGCPHDYAPCPFCDWVEETRSRWRQIADVVVDPDVGWKWGKWTFGFWVDMKNKTYFGIDFGPFEIAWRKEGYRP